jgi:exodeoxyribonuclease V beta subunit
MGGTQSRFHRVAERLKDRHPDDLAQDLRDIASESSGTIAVTRLPSPTVTQWRPTRPPDEAPLQIAQFDREALDTHWGRGSYSGLVRGLKRAPMVESPEAEGIDHADKGTEVDHTGTGLNSAPGTQPRQLPLANFPKGSRAGTCMHEILENHAFENPTELHEVVTEHLEKHGFEEGLADELCGGLREALRTPLGPQAGNIRLDQLRRKPVERLDELDFDLPVLGGTLSGDGSIGGPELARVLGDHAGDCPLLTADALARIETLPGTPLRGYLTGQIDLVFRVHGQEKWFLADYKSNWLGDPNTGRCEIEDYRPERVVQSMDKSLYVLQYHLYTVALHRLLRWRIPDYSYDRHLGGSLYLFLRGMMGPIGPRGADGCPHGVFFDRPPSARIEALDRLLAGTQP